jgi:hypothetical protein
MADDAAVFASLVIASVAAGAAALAFWANYRMVKEMEKDRRVAFIRIQIEELYNPILRRRELFFTPRDRYGTNIWDTDLFPTLVQKLYLAAPKLFKAITSCPTQVIAAIDKTTKSVGTDYDRQLELTDAVYLAAEEELEDLRKELQSIVQSGRKSMKSGTFSSKK